MKQEIYALLMYAEKNDHPGYLAVMALILVLARRKGMDISNAVEEMKAFSHGEIKAAIKVIRTLPEIQNSSYPVEEMVRLLRVEVMGKDSGLLREIAAEARATFPEYFTGKQDKEVIGEIAGAVRRSGEATV